MFVCFVIITGIIAPAPIWTALSDGGVVIPPLALVLVLITRPSNVGSTTLNSIFMIVGLIAGGLLAAVATWAAWAANGHSYSPNTATKGAVFGVIICVFSGILNAWRWRYDLTNVLFLFCCVGLVLMGGMASYSLPFVAWEAAFYMLALGAMAAVFSLLVGWFIYPVPASLQYRRCFSQALVSLAGALGAVEATLIAPLDPGTGRLAGAAGKLDPDTGTDAGLHETVYKVRGALRATRGKLLATQQHHLTVKLELDVYNSPKVFPRYVKERWMAGHKLSSKALAR